jgi:hypothetical protein
VQCRTVPTMTRILLVDMPIIITSVTPADLIETLPVGSPLRSVVSYCFDTLHLSLGETQSVLLNANDVVNALVTIADAAAGRLELDRRERSSGRHNIVRG